MMIRAALPGDAEAVYRLMLELEEGGKAPRYDGFVATYHENLESPQIVYLLAQEDGEAVGFGSLHIQKLLHHGGPVGEIQELVATASKRGSGLGKEMLLALKDEAGRRGCLVLELSCNMRRTAANEFYGHMGFEKTSYKHKMTLDKEGECT